jgi:hypothetical protein
VETDQGGDLWRGTFYRVYQEVQAELKAAWELEHAAEIAAAPQEKPLEWPGLEVGITFDDAKAGAIAAPGVPMQWTQPAWSMWGTHGDAPQRLECSP